MATLLDLTTQALEELRVIAAGETPSAEDLATVTTVYNQHLELWSNENLIDHSGEVIPARSMPGLALLVANLIARRYGKQKDLERVREGRQLLRIANGVTHDGARVRADYY